MSTFTTNYCLFIQCSLKVNDVPLSYTCAPDVYSYSFLSKKSIAYCLLKAAKPKRAAWDTKGQLDDLRAEMAEMKAMFRQTVEDKENQKQQIVEEKTQELSSVESRLTAQVF